MDPISTQPAPDTTDARADRLKAAEDDTGVSLHQRVTIKGTRHGPLSVVGFARINVPGITGTIRCVCVADPAHLRVQGSETVIVVTPDKVQPLGAGEGG